MKRTTLPPLTPRHQLPTGHEVRRSEIVMRDKRNRKGARSSERVRTRGEADHG
jgi:hypothetical protein